ncbi:MAG: helix-turn-helix transcriptional regulator [Candidatus Gracilibacteria bacterium]
MRKIRHDIFAKRIRKLRRQNGLTQRMMSRKCKMSFETFMFVEKGKTKNPTVLTVLKIAKVFGKSIDFLINGVFYTLDYPLKKGKEPDAKLGKMVQRYRMAKGLTQRKLANRARVCYGSVCGIEAGRMKNPTIFTMARIAHTLDVTVDELVA